jgi:hypothetical protein
MNICPPLIYTPTHYCEHACCINGIKVSQLTSQ